MDVTGAGPRIVSVATQADQRRLLHQTRALTRRQLDASLAFVRSLWPLADRALVIMHGRVINPEIGQDEDLPNDFYIRNLDESTTEFTVSPDVVVTLQACYQGGGCVVTEQVDLATWSVLLGAEEDPGLEWDWYGAGSLPYDFTVSNEMVTEILESYLP